MGFFHFSQNNSGGRWKTIQTTNGEVIVRHYIIEADSAEKANRCARKTTEIYFDGCDKEIDCPCCGDRWDPLWQDTKPNSTPCVYGEPDRTKWKAYNSKGSILEIARIIYKNGKIEDVPLVYKD